MQGRLVRSCIADSGMIESRSMINDMPFSTIDDDTGRIDIPEEVREHLHLKKGDRVEFVIGADGKVEIRPASGESLLGLFHRPDLAPRTLEEIREGMIDFLAEDNERIKRGGE